jgi:hypothetical protein
LWTWLKRVVSWIAKPRLAWLAVGVVIGAGIMALRPGATEHVIRWTGLFLQLLGIGTVIVGIEQTRRLFNHPSLLTIAGEWVKQFPPYKRNVVLGAAAGALGLATAKARGYVTSNAPPNSTIEERVASLERNVGHLNKRIDDVYDEFDKSLRHQTAALEQERQDRTAEETKIASKLETSGTGGLHVSAVGAIWLFVGVILSTGSTEIAKWLQ